MHIDLSKECHREHSLGRPRINDRITQSLIFEKEIGEGMEL
jgi:hypothetical protein